MSDEFGFEASPFDIAPELGGVDDEWGRRRTLSVRRPRAGPRNPPTGRRPRPAPYPRRPGPGRLVHRRPRGLVTEPFPVEPSGSEQVRWLQDCLNQALGMSLPVTGLMGPETRSAVRSFQRRQGLRVSGILGPDTERALNRSCSIERTDRTVEDEGLWRLLAGEWDPVSQEEIVIKDNAIVTIRKGPARIQLSTDAGWSALPKSSRVYAIYHTTSPTKRPVYVGEADNVWQRFYGRRRVLKELDVNVSSLANRVVEVYEVAITIPNPEESLVFRHSRKKTEYAREKAYKLRKLAETALAAHLQPAMTDSSKLQDVCVTKGSLTINLGEEHIFTVNAGQVLTAKRRPAISKDAKCSR